MWKLQYYGFFEENTYSVAVPYIFSGNKLILETYQLIPKSVDWIGWIIKEIQSDINAIEPPIKFYGNQKRHFSFDNYFPYKLSLKNNNYSIEKIHIKIHEWIPLEFINSQVVQINGDFQEVLPTRQYRSNWYLENQGENSVVFKWGGNGNEWELKSGKYISGEKDGKSKRLFAKTINTTQLEYIETWEE
jgi:hypothetical protein